MTALTFTGHVPDRDPILALDALVLVVAIALDRFLPEPPALIHPVVWMGRAIHAFERLAPSQPLTAFLYGGATTIAVVGISTVVTWTLISLLATLGPVAYVLGGAVILRSTFAVGGLFAAAELTRQALARDRPGMARRSLRNLVSRDPSPLTPSLVAAAAIESVAENTTDSFIAPWLAFAVLGVPAAVAYRAVNTLDSMLGYRGAYEYLGKFPARLDDLVNYLPSRLSAMLILAAGALSRLPTRRGWRIMLRDRSRTASPNAGWTMSAMAGLLGTSLEKPRAYLLGGELPPPGHEDIGRAVTVARGTAALALVASLALLTLRYAVAG